MTMYKNTLFTEQNKDDNNNSNSHNYNYSENIILFFSAEDNDIKNKGKDIRIYCFTRIGVYLMLHKDSANALFPFYGSYWL